MKIEINEKGSKAFYREIVGEAKHSDLVIKGRQ